jgi:hypothetical protein
VDEEVSSSPARTSRVESQRFVELASPGKCPTIISWLPFADCAL